MNGDRRRRDLPAVIYPTRSRRLRTRVSDGAWTLVFGVIYLAGIAGLALGTYLVVGCTLGALWPR